MGKESPPTYLLPAGRGFTLKGRTPLRPSDKELTIKDRSTGNNLKFEHPRRFGLGKAHKGFENHRPSNKFLSLKAGVNGWSIKNLFFITGLIFSLSTPIYAIEGLVWPTPNRAFLESKPISEYVQPTASGEVTSGLFGCTRSDGYQFHEGLDLFPIKRDIKGEPTDPIFSVLPGKIVYTSNKSALSAYGRYVVIEHNIDGLVFQTLYAHLASIDVSAGQTVKAGDKIAIMGHTASNGLPNERSHLHLEFNLRLSDNFEPWYKRQKYGTPNYHKNYNGFNFVGWDPINVYREYKEGRLTNMAAFLKAQPTAIIAVIRTNQIPSFIRRNKALLSSEIQESGVQGWQIEFSPEGLPKLWTPLTSRPKAKITLMDGSAPQMSCKRLKGGSHKAGKDLKGTLELLFGGRY